MDSAAKDSSPSDPWIAAEKKYFEFEHAAGRGHVLVGRHAADSAFMHADHLGDVPQHQRAKPGYAVLKELLLLQDDPRRPL